MAFLQGYAGSHLGLFFRMGFPRRIERSRLSCCVRVLCGHAAQDALLSVLEPRAFFVHKFMIVDGRKPLHQRLAETMTKPHPWPLGPRAKLSL